MPLAADAGHRHSGPLPETIIDEVTPEALRMAMRAVLADWDRSLRDSPAILQSRGYQSYAVLSLCRILYTRRHGAIISKRSAASWATETLDPRWRALIEQAITDRLHATGASSAEAIEQTLAFLRDAQQVCGSRF